MRIALLFVVLLMGMQAAAQSSRYKDTIMDGKLYHSVDDPPFKGYYLYVNQMPEPGYDFNEYIKKVMHYPDSARANNIQGRVIVKFVINEDGSITDCIVLKGVGGGCDEEALKLVRNMPRWKPIQQNGTPVKFEHILTVNFALE